MRVPIGVAILVLLMGVVRDLPAQEGSDILLDSATVRMSPARTLADLLAGRVPGMGVTYASGARGVAPQVGLRRPTGLHGAAEPLLYVDGVLIRDDQYWLGPKPDDHRPSFAWDMPVDEIHSVTIVQGQSSGALMPFGASRGAVLVRTRRPSGGTARVGGFVESRGASETTDFPTNVLTFRSGSTDSVNTCTLSDQALGNCTAGATVSANPLEDGALFGRGSALRAGVNATGALLSGSYRAAAILDREESVFAPSRGERVDLSASYESTAERRLRYGIDARVSNSTQKAFPWELALREGMFGRPNVSDATFDYIRDGAEPLHATRATLGADASWPLRAGLTLEARAGIDRYRRRSSTHREQPGFFSPTMILDAAAESGMSSWSFEGALRSEHRLFGKRAALRATLFASSTAFDDSTHEVMSDPPILSGSAVDRQATLRAVGVSLFEQVSFGANSQRTVGVGMRVPNVSLTNAQLDGLGRLVQLGWDLTGEAFFPRVAALDRLRLHLSFGEGPDLDPMLGLLAGDIAVAAPVLARTPQASESEFGISSRLFGGRLGADLRLFSRITSDFPLIQTMGFPGTSRVAREGNEVTTQGEELRLDVSGVAIGPVRMQAAASVATARERVSVLNLPEYMYDVPLTFDAMVERDHAIGRYLTRDVTWSDANSDGVIDSSEVALRPDVFSGRGTRPDRLLAVSGSLAWGPVSAGAVLDGQYGQRRHAEGLSFRCRLRVCGELYLASTPLEEQAWAVASRYEAGYTGPLHDAGFTRLREAWVRLTIPGRLVPDALGGARLTLSGHQLAVWSRYRGLDPEIGTFIGPSLQRNEYYGQPILPSWSLRLDIGH